MKGSLLNKLKFIISILVLVLIFSAVHVSANSSAEATATVSNNKLSSDDVHKEDSPNYDVLQVQLEDYIGTRPGKVSVYVKDLITGETLNIKSDQVYVAASTIKLPLVLYIYELAAQGEIDLDAKLTYTPEYYAQGTGILQGKPFGGQYTIRELSRLSIEYSDNVAWKMLLGFIGQDKLTAYEKSLGAEATGGDNGLYITTPEDMGIYLERLLNFSKEKPKYGDKIIHYMANSIFYEGIPQDLPDDIVVAHKMGALNDKFHDVGIVFGKRPYIITIFTDEAWEEVSLQTLADVSHIVYDFQESIK
ncbi:MAG: serine hydrolase [Thermoanaerobacteraceae bacterium]|nr:serine hydrolase [Thermoanaerobacteraceae bacterium]